MPERNPFLDILAALVPAAERDELIRRYDAEPWNELIMIAIGERFYRLQRVEERRDGVWWVHAHMLQEAHPNEIFRGLLRYEPPV